MGLDKLVVFILNEQNRRGFRNKNLAVGRRWFNLSPCKFLIYVLTQCVQNHLIFRSHNVYKHVPMIRFGLEREIMDNFLEHGKSTSRMERAFKQEMNYIVNFLGITIKTESLVARNIRSGMSANLYIKFMRTDPQSC